MAAPATNLTIAGDLEPLDTDPTTAGIQAGYDALDNLLVTNEADPNRADILYDNAGNDLLQGLGGNDTLIAWRGGDDVLEGGSGRDYLSGGAGHDTLVGGDDSDVLLGGEGEDLLIGGGGNDTIYGDQHGAASIDWTLTRTIAVVDSNTTYRSDTTHGTRVAAAVGAADVIYGGAGDDWIEGGPGNDFIEAGADNDVVFGGEGSDVILGGTGNDVLIGNAGFGRPENDGGDFIDGGAGGRSDTGRWWQ